MTYDNAVSNHYIPVPIPLLTKLENEYLANSKNYGMQRIEVRITPQCREVKKSILTVNIGSTRNYSKLIKVNTILDNVGSDQKHLNICSINPPSVENKSYSLLNTQNYNNISRTCQEIELPVSIPLLTKLENEYLSNFDNFSIYANYSS